MCFMLNSEEIYVISGGTSLELDISAAKSMAIINKENHKNKKTTYSLSFIVFAKTDTEALNAVRLILNSDLNKSKGKFDHVSFIPYRITNCTNKSIIDELVYNQNHDKTKSDNIMSKLMSKQLPVIYKDITTGDYNIFYKYISQLNRYKSIKSVKIFTINQCDTYSHPVNNISIDESDISRMNYYFPLKHSAFPEIDEIIDTYNFGEFQFDDFFKEEIRDGFSTSTHYIFIINSECSFDYLQEFTDFLSSYCKINHLPIDAFDVLIKTINGEYICCMDMMRNVKNNCKIM